MPEKTCTPLEGGGAGRIYYGQCLKLIYKGENLSGECLSKIIVSEGQRGRNPLRSVLFLTSLDGKSRGTVSFHGVPTTQGFRGNSHLFMAVRAIKPPKGLHKLQHLRATGNCDISTHQGGGNYIQCLVNDPTKKITRGQFASLKEKPLTCQEDFLDDSWPE